MTDETNTDTMMKLLDRIEHLEAEKKEIAADIAEVWKEAKSQGFTKELKKAHGIRKMKSEDRAVLGVYVQALGLFD
jgi:uncharacterized protein (UPF0335 family)